MQGGEQTLCLDDSGRAHAGENRKVLLAQRQARLDKPWVRSEALSHHEAEATALMRCPCLAHGRRQCSDLDDVLPQECAGVLEALRQVLDHDEHARHAPLSPAARLASHQAESRPIMDALQEWLDQQCPERRVEPNRALGKAIASMQGHWATLPRCVSGEHAPLDNHLVERALKRCIRQRKNALCSKTASSASMASGLTSLRATCLHAGVHALDDLVALQAHRAAVCAKPAAWMPWTSQARLAPPEPTRRPSGAICARAARGTRAAVVVGHHVTCPCDKRCRQSQ